MLRTLERLGHRELWTIRAGPPCSAGALYAPPLLRPQSGTEGAARRKCFASSEKG